MIAGGHVVVAHYDLQAQDLVSCIFDPNGDRTPAATTIRPTRPAPRRQRRRRRAADRTPDAGPTTRRRRSGRALAAPRRCRRGTARSRLNILLIGADQRPKEGTFNTDTLIVVSIDPKTKQVAMFSLPRDTVDVPLPPGPGPDRSSGRPTRARSTASGLNARNRSDALPRQRRDARLQRPQGDPRRPLRPRHPVLRRGQLPRLPGPRRRPRRRDDQRPDPGPRRPLPGRRAGASIRVYIPAGIQHMNGAPGAHLRPLAPRLERLRPGAAPAAGDPVAPRAGRPAQGPRQPQPAAQGPQVVVQDRHPAGQAAGAPRPVEPDRHEPDPLLRVLPAALRQRGHRQPRLPDRAERQPDPPDGRTTRSRSTPSSSSSASSSATRTPSCGSSTARARSARRARSPPTSSTSA